MSENFKSGKIKSMLHALFEYANEGIIVSDKNGNIVIANPTTEKQFGYEVEMLIDKSIEDLVPESVSNHQLKHEQEILESPHPRAMGKGIDLYGHRKNGSKFPIEISVSLFKTSEGEYLMYFIVDITERKKQELEIKRAQEEIIQLNVDLEKRVKERTKELGDAIEELARTKAEVIQSYNKERELNELKSRFVSTASHEFRTPLATILSSVSLIGKYNEPNDEEKRKKHINRIKLSVTHLTEILNNFLSLGKLEEGIVRNNPEPMILDQFIKSLVDDNRTLLKEGQVVKYKHIKGDTAIHLDKYLFHSILLNLISNAIKYSPENKPIHITTEIVDDKLTLSVRDEGMGIPSSDLENLFDRFFRAKNVENIQGTGLGLNIVKKYAEIMNAEIILESTEGVGTTFQIEFSLI
ncbi:MAG: PAS domain-containing sensor histidine kinase [Bacteroidota bacterium]|nr:PAS domain-containing sensor histidine kinase [Bacteroidota bacterium]